MPWGHTGVDSSCCLLRNSCARTEELQDHCCHTQLNTVSLQYHSSSGCAASLIMEDKGRRASKRARRPPPRLDNGGDEHSVQQVCHSNLKCTWFILYRTGLASFMLAAFFKDSTVAVVVSGAVECVLRSIMVLVFGHHRLNIPLPATWMCLSCHILFSLLGIDLS